MNVYEYELSGLADTSHDRLIQSKSDEIDWDDKSIPVETASCENPF